MKKKPAHKFSKETGMKPILGTMACESLARLNAWKITGCNAFDSNVVESKPFSFWTEQDILEYLVRYNIPYASVYGDIVSDDNGLLHTTGCQRTGCIFCAFGINQDNTPNRFQRLKQTHPKLWEYCMKPLDKGGLGMRKVLDFINIDVE